VPTHRSGHLRMYSMTELPSMASAGPGARPSSAHSTVSAAAASSSTGTDSDARWSAWQQGGSVPASPATSLSPRPSLLGERRGRLPISPTAVARPSTAATRGPRQRRTVSAYVLPSLSPNSAPTPSDAAAASPPVAVSSSPDPSASSHTRRASAQLADAYFARNSVVALGKLDALKSARPNR